VRGCTRAVVVGGRSRLGRGGCGRGEALRLKRHGAAVHWKPRRYLWKPLIKTSEKVRFTGCLLGRHWVGAGVEQVEDCRCVKTCIGELPFD
jgi:hypothetical protein